jgi:hypothetical protein
MSEGNQKDFYVYTHSLAGQPCFYVGKGTEKRVKTIRRKNKHHTNIVNKYGRQNIIVRSMLCRSEQHALDLEVKLIAALRNGGVKLVNRTDGGDGMSGYKHSEESKAKMSEAGKCKVFSEEHKANMSESAKGKPKSDEHKAKISVIHKGKVFSEESRAKMSKTHTGKVLSEEHKAKLSAAATGRVLSEETKAKISEAKKSPSEETRATLTIACKNKPPVSEETKAKISESAKLAWQKRKLDKDSIE